MALSLLPSPEIERLKTQIAQGQNLSGFRSPVPRISPPTAGIFARKPADPGAYPVAQPYAAPPSRLNLLGAEPGIDEAARNKAEVDRAQKVRADHMSFMSGEMPLPDMLARMTEARRNKEILGYHPVYGLAGRYLPEDSLFNPQGQAASKEEQYAQKSLEEIRNIQKHRGSQVPMSGPGAYLTSAHPFTTARGTEAWRAGLATAQKQLASQMGKSPARLAFDDASLPYLDDGFIPGITTNVDAAQIDDSLLAEAEGANYEEFHGGGFDEGGFDEGDVEEIADMDVQEFEAYS